MDCTDRLLDNTHSEEMNGTPFRIKFHALFRILIDSHCSMLCYSGEEGINNTSIPNKLRGHIIWN